MKSISSCLWFDNQAEEAVDFYMSVFKNSEIINMNHYGEEGYNIHHQPAGSVLTVSFRLEDHLFLALNGGPVFQFTPAISFYVTCDSEDEISTLWEKLSVNGSVLMKLDTYPFSKKYGWIQDKYGVSWQLILPFDDQKLSKTSQKIAPCLMFCGEQQGNAEKAMNFYVSLFDRSEIVGNQHYDKNFPGPEGQIVHAEFLLKDQRFVTMDSGIKQSYTFNEAISFVVHCGTQEAIDHYWDKLSDGGDKKAQQCGWLKDKYGLSWQIVPTILNDYLNDSDKTKSSSVMKALLQMKKLNIRELQQAYNQ